MLWIQKTVLACICSHVYRYLHCQKSCMVQSATKEIPKIPFALLNIFWKMNYPTTHFLLKFFSSNLNCLHPIMSLSLTPPKKRVSKNYNWQTHEECGILLLQYYSILIVIWKSCLKRFVILHKVNGLYMYIQNKWFLVIYNSDLHVNLNFTTADLPYTLVPRLNAMHDDEIQNTMTFYI